MYVTVTQMGGVDNDEINGVIVWSRLLYRFTV